MPRYREFARKFQDIVAFAKHQAKRGSRVRQLKDQLCPSLEDTLDAARFTDAISLANGIVNFLDTYLSQRCMVEVCRHVKQWKFDESSNPPRIVASVEPPSREEVDRITLNTEVAVMTEILVKNIAPSLFLRAVKINDDGVLVIQARTEGDRKAMNRLLKTIKAQQERQRARAAKLN